MGLRVKSIMVWSGCGARAGVVSLTVERRCESLLSLVSFAMCFIDVRAMATCWRGVSDDPALCRMLGAGVIPVQVYQLS